MTIVLAYYGMAAPGREPPARACCADSADAKMRCRDPHVRPTCGARAKSIPRASTTPACTETVHAGDPGSTTPTRAKSARVGDPGSAPGLICFVPEGTFRRHPSPDFVDAAKLLMTSLAPRSSSCW